MSTIDEVRSTEKRVSDVLDAMKRDPATGDRYVDQLKNATDEYARAVRELEL
jgi:hypothetical protein